VAALLSLSGTGSAAGEEIGRIGLDFQGNDVVVEAFDDPKVAGVTCHLVRFDRGLIDRLRKGNWFENPSNMSIACRQTGPIEIGDINLSADGEEVFSERASLVFKRLKVRRIYDAARQTLIYVSYSTEPIEASAKNGISTVSLYGLDVKLPAAAD
jgi:CreA protein